MTIAPSLTATALEARLVCLHDGRGVCWLCSDQDPRWREWRKDMELGEEPPNAPASRVRRANPLPPLIVPPAAMVFPPRPRVEFRRELGKASETVERSGQWADKPTSFEEYHQQQRRGAS